MQTKKPRKDRFAKLSLPLISTVNNTCLHDNFSHGENSCPAKYWLEQCSITKNYFKVNTYHTVMINSFNSVMPRLLYINIWICERQFASIASTQILKTWSYSFLVWGNQSYRCHHWRYGATTAFENQRIARCAPCCICGPCLRWTRHYCKRKCSQQRR